LGFVFAPFRSKSGGLHIYFFFQEPEPAAKVITVLKKIVEVLALDVIYPRCVEVFPKQASVIPGDRNANGLLLPFFNIAHPDGCPNRLYDAEGRLTGIKNAKGIIDSLFVSLANIEKTIEELPYHDAPYCIQALLLTGALFKEGDHRNDFLFTAALYLKLRDKNGFEKELSVMNDRLEAPLEESDLQAIYRSATGKDWQIAGQCKKSPCVDFCNKPLCKQRVYGPWKDKGNVVSDIEFGKTTKVMTREPYYLIEVRIAGTEEYTKIWINDTSELMNQRAIQRACIQHLNYAPSPMKQSAWTNRLNQEVLCKIEEQQVAETTDTTDASILYRHFCRYLTHARSKNNEPYMVGLGHVYYHENTYYFDGGAFKEYLSAVNFHFANMNIRAELESFGCTESKVSYVSTSGVERSIPCWKKQEDASLKDLEVFYEEARAEDARAAADIKLDREDEEGNDVDDHRF
jgi:hypothetical protein